jgi:hypothetical protein
MGGQGQEVGEGNQRIKATSRSEASEGAGGEERGDRQRGEIDREISPSYTHKQFQVDLPTLRRGNPTLVGALIFLSRRRWGNNREYPLLYLGRYGYGFCRAVRREQTNDGTFGFLDLLKEREELSDLQVKILENLFFEGTIFASYDSLVAYVSESEAL